MSTESRYTVVDASGDSTLPVIIIHAPIEGPTGLTGTHDYSGGYTGYTGYTDFRGPTGHDQYTECVMIGNEVCVNNGHTGKGCTGKGHTGCWG